MPYVHVGKENSGDIDLFCEAHGPGKPVVDSRIPCIPTCISPFRRSQ